MANRQEQKAQRKAAREQAAREEAARAKRARLLQFGVGGLLVAAILAGLILLGTTSGEGGGDEPIAADDSEAVADVQLPPQRFEELEAAVEASGCVLEEAEDQGGQHLTESVPLDYYNTNPPSSGNHNPVPAQDGVYPAGSAPEHEAWIHSLEHGRIVFQYRPGTEQEQIDTLRALTQETVLGAPGGYHTLVMENNTEMPYAFAAVNWTRFLGCEEMSPASIDAMRLFREEYTDDAPERVP
ncbi:MAG: DUF3105 domain-containing protein [Solirubrobacteraceae bacterium MAG38_C4-C5]|nr:DUF3105 domain-containing protein [Candidatus Siliceabacter maunaloa]